jgi:hypothetical protein
VPISKLGQAFTLRGVEPAESRPCRTCGVAIPPRRGGGRLFEHCAACTETQCKRCRGYRGHKPECPWLVEIQCRGCGGPLSPEDRRRRRVRCARCRPNVVTDADLTTLYTETRKAALRYARHLVGKELAEDLVQLAALGLVVGRETLSHSKPALLMHAVELAATKFYREGRSVDPMLLGPADLEALEEALEARRRGRVPTARPHP